MRLPTTPIIRALTDGDMAAIKEIVDQTGLFPSDMLDEMTASYRSGTSSEQMWLTAVTDRPVGVAYCIPEALTEGTWNTLLIVVHPDAQGQGIGGAVMKAIEDRLGASGQRLLIVETSGLPEYERTRRFYAKLGYTQEARIPEFYKAGEDKIIFCKRLVGV